MLTNIDFFQFDNNKCFHTNSFIFEFMNKNSDNIMKNNL